MIDQRAVPHEESAVLDGMGQIPPSVRPLIAQLSGADDVTVA